ncbi:methyltransferase domain-containing protein [Cryobacterium sp. TMT1-2-1]|uniref:class I SAM-dependent methyltransferase n=1 Tax=Cryobacterium sp. TMT1-2-1 TaxID=1259232 RepID=UPI001069FEDE|nr:class I SAM-dependent methyltransferase [Cryobacterium sp. TMT1-2-1]TFD45076.1 methyltransferase domain-containing protein [Cryobacterium sp. TMT1-2-1]
MTFAVDGAPPSGSVDILIDGHRVWSTTPTDPDVYGRIRLHWPAALVPYMKGRATISVQDSGTGETIAGAVGQIGRSTSPLVVANDQGHWLAVNKWQRMGTSFEGDDSGIRGRLLTRSKVLVDQLEHLGYVACITGGTLLGAVRLGDILANDDDIDLSVLLTNSHPSDLSLDSYRLEDQLGDLGYIVVRHSNAHLQVTFLHDNGEIDCYVDIFSAFFRNDEEFCQPFHVRSNVPRTSITPVGSRELGGVSFPVPAVPEDWLASCYGPNWETPDPSFRFATPPATRRRFDSWFGSQDMNRVYWEEAHGRAADRRQAGGDALHVAEMARLLPVGAPVVDLGCGSGINTEAIAAQGRDVIGVDYSFRALALARGSIAPDTVDLRYLNLYDRRRMLEFGAELVQSGRVWHVNLGQVLAGLTREGRENVFLLLRLVLREGAVAVATFDTSYAAWRYSADNPETWHLPVDWLRAEAGRQKLSVEIASTSSRRTKHGRRRTATVVLRLATPSRQGQKEN